MVFSRVMFGPCSFLDWLLLCACSLWFFISARLMTFATCLSFAWSWLDPRWDPFPGPWYLWLYMLQLSISDAWFCSVAGFCDWPWRDSFGECHICHDGGVLPVWPFSCGPPCGRSNFGQYAVVLEVHFYPDLHDLRDPPEKGFCSRKFQIKRITHIPSKIWKFTEIPHFLRLCNLLLKYHTFQFWATITRTPPPSLSYSQATTHLITPIPKYHNSSVTLIITLHKVVPPITTHHCTVHI